MKVNRTILSLLQNHLYELFVVLLIAFLIVFSIRIFSGKKEQWTDIRLQVYGKNWEEDFSGGYAYSPPRWVYNSISVGDVEVNSVGKKISEVIAADRYWNSFYITVRAKTTQNTTTGEVFYQGAPVRNGTELTFLFPKTRVVGQVISIPSSPSIFKTIQIVALARNLEPWIYEKITAGDTMRNGSTQEEIARITKVELQPSTSSILFQNPASGKSGLFLEQNARLRDAYVTLQIQVKEERQEVFFAENQKIKIGTSIGLDLGTYELSWLEIQNISSE